MEEEMKVLTYEEARACLTRHFASDDGFLAQIEKGGEIDFEQIRVIEAALRSLQYHWKNQSLVPRHIVGLLWNVIPRLEACRSLSPQRQTEIHQVIASLSPLLEIPFVTAPTMSEEQAMALVSQHVIGPSFILEVLHAGRIDENALEDFLMAVDTLAQTWRQKDYIAKVTAGALIGTQDIVSRDGPFAPVIERFPVEKKQRLQEIQQELLEHVHDCFR